MNNKKINVLIFPAEGVNAIELHDALSSCVNIKLYGASSVERHGIYVYRNYIGGLPQISDEKFIKEFNSIIAEYSIDVIFPTHDTVAMYFAENQHSINAKIIEGDKETAMICRSKIKTHNLLSDCDFIPHRITSCNEQLFFPLFAKPDEGQGAVGAKKIDSIEELQKLDFDCYLVAEYLPGEEYTVDCFTDKDGNLRYVSPRTRERLMAGISVAGRTIVPTNEISRIAEIINSRLNFLGLWFFQVKKNIKGELKLMEISTRCAGTMCLTRARGVNLPLLSIYTAFNYDIAISDNSYNVKMDRTLISRYNIDYYYNTVYIDFDDTITLNGEINLNVIRFLYQCWNKRKRIILLTRHADVIEETLRKYAISILLFNEIVSIRREEPKSMYINSKEAIFIDNAYNERSEVAHKCQIPVFDVDGIEFLLDWRY